MHLKCAIDVLHSENSTVEEIVDKIHKYLRQKRNVALDRVHLRRENNLKAKVSTIFMYH